MDAPTAGQPPPIVEAPAPGHRPPAEGAPAGGQVSRVEAAPAVPSLANGAPPAWVGSPRPQAAARPDSTTPPAAVNPPHVRPPDADPPAGATQGLAQPLPVLPPEQPGGDEAPDTDPLEEPSDDLPPGAWSTRPEAQPPALPDHARPEAPLGDAGIGYSADFNRSLIYSGALALVLAAIGLVMVGWRRRQW